MNFSPLGFFGPNSMESEALKKRDFQGPRKFIPKPQNDKLAEKQGTKRLRTKRSGTQRQTSCRYFRSVQISELPQPLYVAETVLIVTVQYVLL